MASAAITTAATAAIHAAVVLPLATPIPRFQSEHRECLPTADVDLSSALVAAIYESPPAFRPASGSSPAPLLRHVPGSPSHLLHRMLSGRSTFRRAQPNAKMSARRSTTRPFACSGDIYAAVPRIMPGFVAAILRVGEFESAGLAGALSRAFANPKSSTLTCPWGVIFTSPGSRSRWTMPFSCAASRASQMCFANVSINGKSTALHSLFERLPFDQFQDQKA